MAISPMGRNATLPALAGTFKYRPSGALINLTGATLSLTIRDKLTGAERAGQGQWTITDAVNGAATYAWAAADTAVAGNYTLRVVATYPTGTLPLQYVDLVIY